MLKIMKNFYASLIVTGNFLQSLVLFGIRLFWGWGFFIAGRDKLSNIDPIIDYFRTLNIPVPFLNAYAVASIECIGGFCLLIGFASRLVSIPLMIVMTVAMVVAHHEAFWNAFANPQLFVQQSPFNFFMAALIVFVFGPGVISIDALIKRLFFKNESYYPK